MTDPQPFPELASINGVIGATADATIPVKDDGFLRGDGVFEVIKLYRGHPFALSQHLDRLERSAAVIELTIDRPALETELEALMAEAGAVDAGLRIVATRGGRRVCTIESLPDWPASTTVATVDYSPSIILTGVKSISYAANMQASRLAVGHGAEEAILVRPDGIVLEAPTSTIFWVGDDGCLQTPSLSCGILDSITRGYLIDAIGIAEGEYSVAALAATNEAFLASTTREIQAIAAIDGRALDVVGGSQTETAQAAFAAAVAAHLS